MQIPLRLEFFQCNRELASFAGAFGRGNDVTTVRLHKLPCDVEAETRAEDLRRFIGTADKLFEQRRHDIGGNSEAGVTDSNDSRVTLCFKRNLDPARFRILHGIVEQVLEYLAKFFLVA